MLMQCLFAAWTVSSWLIVSTPAAAQQPPTTVDEVSITGEKRQTTEEKIETFVETTSVKTGTGQLGRWDKEICVSIENLRPDAALIIKERIETVARDVGLVAGAPECKPNIVIIATDNAQALLSASVKKNRRAFLDGSGTLRVGQDELDRFIASNQPIRWWFVVKRVMWDGQSYEEGQIVDVHGKGRIGSTVRADFNHAFIVLDVSRIGTVKFPALADYIAMVSLAQISPDAELPDVPSVLRLFEDEGANSGEIDGMTSWDRALLKALYTSPRNAKRLKIQQDDMARAMQEALAEDAPNSQGQNDRNGGDR